jgi:hypothetical protein
MQNVFKPLMGDHFNEIPQTLPKGNVA